MNVQKIPDKQIFDQWHDDPSNWKLGVLYYNKLDKRIFPPKRLKGSGWTVNFANPYSYMTLTGVVFLFYIFTKYVL